MVEDTKNQPAKQHNYTSNSSAHSRQLYPNPIAEPNPTK